MRALQGRWSVRRIPVLVAAMLCEVLALTMASPVTATGEGDRAPGQPALLGGFALGASLEGQIDPRDGAFAFALPVGGLSLAWDSRAVGAGGAAGLGGGWSFGLPGIETAGGVRVAPASGGRYEMDASQRSGLAGYVRRDLRFEAAAPGAVLGERDSGGGGHGVAGGEPNTPEVAYRLMELGGVVTSFDASGLPLARVTATGARTDWRHDEAGRLVLVVDEHGVETRLDWDSATDVLLVHRAASLPLGSSEGGARTWRVELGADGPNTVRDPLGGRTQLGYDDAGLLSRLVSESGAVAEVSWQRFDDRLARVDRVRVLDGVSGAELSTRSWAPTGANLSTGWPGEVRTSRAYGTVLSDGVATISSEYDGRHRLRSRRLTEATGSGMVEVQEQRFEYPALPDGVGVDDGALPGNWSRPTRVEVVSRRADGASRTAVTDYVFDELGRLVSETAPDGTVTTTDFDDESAEPHGVPVGLPVRTTVTAPDGSVDETVHRLNPTGSAVAETAVRTRVPGHELTTTGLTQFTVDDSGFVTEQRAFPNGDRAAEPEVTVRSRLDDAAAGTLTVTETTGAGTPGEATTTQVVSLVHGGVRSATDALGNVSGASYDALGRPVEQTDASGRATRIAYASARRHGRNAVTMTRPDGVAVTQVHDALGRLVETTDNIVSGAAVAGAVRVSETRRYPGPGVVEIIDAWGATTEVRTDLFGREVESVAANGLVKLTAYDAVANTVTTALTPTGRIEDAAYRTTGQLDDAGRTVGVSVVNADGSSGSDATVAFDGLGRERSASDGLLQSTIDYDAFGRPELRTLTDVAEHPPGSSQPDADAAELRAIRRFDGFGRTVQKSLSDGRGSSSGGTSAFDAHGREIANLDRAGRADTTEYTPDGLPRRVVTGAGRVTETEYDARTRKPVRTTTSSPAGPSVTSVTARDPVTDRVTAVFDPSDRDGTEIAYLYDAFGNTLQVRYPDGSTIAHEYDAHGRKTATIDVTGAVTTFAYDLAGRLIEATQRTGPDDDAEVLAGVEYAYDAYGRVQRLDRDTGVATEYRYTAAGDIAAETTTAPDGTALAQREYTYDPHGRLVERVDRVRDETGEVLETTSTRYRYDAMRRLTGSTLLDGEGSQADPIDSIEYELTVAGDIARTIVTERRDSSHETITTRSFEYGASGELEGVVENGVRRAQAFDAAGNLISAADGTRYAYDALNRPISVNRDDEQVDLVYWPDGTRRSTTHRNRGATEHIDWYWDGGQLQNERHERSGDAQPPSAGSASYLIGAGRHARTTRSASDDGAHLGAASVAHYTLDRHGSITELTDADGEIAERYAYSDYGFERALHDVDELPALDRNPFRFAGELTEPDGAQLLTDRLYLPGAMRFASPDPAPEFNGYAFGHLDPITMVDPSGRTPIFDKLAGWVFLFAGAVTTLVSVASAVMTGGTSISVLGLAGWAFETAGIAIGAALAADEFTPFLDLPTRTWLVVSESALGIAAFFAGGFGMADAPGDLLAAGTAWDAAVRGFNSRSVAIMKGDPLGRLRNGTNWARMREFAEGLDALDVDRKLPPKLRDELRDALSELHLAWAQSQGLKAGRIRLEFTSFGNALDQVEQGLGHPLMQSLRASNTRARIAASREMLATFRLKHAEKFSHIDDLNALGDEFDGLLDAINSATISPSDVYAFLQHDTVARFFGTLEHGRL